MFCRKSSTLSRFRNVFKIDLGLTVNEDKDTWEILRKVRQIEIRTRRLVEETLSGHYQSVFKGAGLNFDEVREYVPGDEIRSIDWNVTARTGKPFVKKYKEERELTILLLVDLSGSGEFGSVSKSKREMAAELASVIAFSAIRNNDKVGLILFTDKIELFIPPKKGRTHILRLIRDLLFFKTTSRGTDLNSALDFTNEVIKRQAVVFLVSDFQLPGRVDAALAGFRSKLKLTGRHHDLIAISISDPREKNLPDIGLINLEDLETGEQIEVDTGSIDVRRRYEEASARAYDAVRRAILASGVDYLELVTDKAYLPALLGFFKKREKRRL